MLNLVRQVAQLCGAGGAAVAVLLLVATQAHAQPSARLESNVRFLADDLLEGRGTPSRGLELSALYLAQELRAAGWQPLTGADYLQRYDLLSFNPTEMTTRVEINGFVLNKNEFVLGPAGMKPGDPIEADLIMSGYGIDAPEKQHRDYEGIDVKRRASVVVPGAPWRMVTNPYGYDRILGKAVSARNRGAAITVVVVRSVAADAYGDPDLGLANGLARSPVAVVPALGGRPASGLGPVLAITQKAWDRVIAPTTGRKFASIRRRPGEVRGLSLGRLSARIDGPSQSSRPANVVAILPGTDPLLKDEYVLLTAHYDHVGLLPDADARDRVFNGADDNASGTAAVLETARRLAARPHRRPVVILLDSAEERGLLGSAYFAYHSPIPLEGAVVDINVDMVGRSDGNVQAIANGSDELFALIRREGQRVGITVLPDQQPDWRVLNLSDDYNFARRGIPSVEFFTGFHGDYHALGDEADKIKYENLAKITDIIGAVAEMYADGEPRPKVRWPEWFPLDGQ